MISTMKILLAAWALTLPSGTPTPWIDPADLRTAALAMELADEDEIYLFSGTYEPQEYPINLLRDRYELAKNCNYPPASDLHRFPQPRDLCIDTCHAISIRQGILEDQKSLTIMHRQWIFNETLSDLERRRQAWKALGDAKAYEKAPWWVRVHLASLRDNIGEGPYFAACMPGSVP